MRGFFSSISSKRERKKFRTHLPFLLYFTSRSLRLKSARLIRGVPPNDRASGNASLIHYFFYRRGNGREECPEKMQESFSGLGWSAKEIIHQYHPSLSSSTFVRLPFKILAGQAISTRTKAHRDGFHLWFKEYTVSPFHSFTGCAWKASKYFEFVVSCKLYRSSSYFSKEQFPFKVVVLVHIIVKLHHERLCPANNGHLFLLH